MRILIVYGTSEGQTAKVAGYLAERIRERGGAVDVVDGHAVPDDLNLTRYEAAIVGSSVHSGRFQPCIVDFIREHRAQLRHMPGAFFSVSLSEAGVFGQKQRERLVDDTTRMLDEAGWHPDRIASFAGAFAYSRYSWATRMVMRWYARRAGVPVDTSHDAEYTDWAAVGQFATEFASRVRPLPRTAMPA